MKITHLSMQPLEIPFNLSFQHASSSRAKTEAVIAKVQTSEGITGIGEGCPRHYVTGESVDSALEFFQAHQSEFSAITSVDRLHRWVEENRSTIDSSPSAFCAVELALLDALSKQQDQSVESLLSLQPLRGEFHYSGVLGSSNPKVFHKLLKTYLDLHITDLKVKLFGDLSIDSENIKLLGKQNQQKLRIRFDANNFWQDPDCAIEYIKNLDCPAFALEEPLQPRDYQGLHTVSSQLKMKIIVDESFTRYHDFTYIENHADIWIINLRVSKMGGIIRSLEIAETAKQLDIPIIIGAQVGETSILTRAALTVANEHRPNLLAQEGAFGTYLLERDLIEPSIMFGKSGILRI